MHPQYGYLGLRRKNQTERYVDENVAKLYPTIDKGLFGDLVVTAKELRIFSRSVQRRDLF